MDNQKNEFEKMMLEELDTVAGGIEGPAYKALKAYWAELSAKYNAPNGACRPFS